MAAQDVREIIPRVRRAIEGPVTPPGALTDDQVLALAADALADVILLTAGQWEHELLVSERDETTNVPIEWTIDPELSLPEESMIAAQAAITYFFHQFKDLKVAQRIQNEGQEWEYQISATVLRDWIKMLQEQRDESLEALGRSNPALARYGSFLEVRDSVGAALLEPWRGGGSGGQALLPA